MNKIKKSESKLLLFLVAAIGVLCAGFIIIGCGSGSQSSLKVADPFAAATALDFTDCPVAGMCSFAFDSASLENEDEYSIQGKEITIEAWVMPKSTSTDVHSVISRMGERGTVLYTIGVDANWVTPAFKIRRVIEGVAAASTSTVEYMVSSSADIPTNAWSHVAGVLVNKAHSTGADTCSAPHLDIFVDGTFSGCATTLGGTSAAGTTDNNGNNDCIGGDDDGGPCLDGGLDLTGIMGFAHNPADGTLGTAYKGAIDETRLWTVDRTDKLVTCKDRELDSGSGDCGRNGTGLIAYQRYNEGEGYSIADFAGIGSGTKEYKDTIAACPPEGFCHWETGWIAGAPITPAD